MSAPEELLNEQDPDYVSATSNEQTRQKIYEENARNITAKKITAIVEKEFSQQIDLKEKEILQIQERLHKTLKIFHLLRYIIITNFYNRKQCQIPQAAETTKQTRIHPAIKTLLGKSPRSSSYVDLAVPSTSTDPRFLYDDKSHASDASTTVDNTCKIEENANKHDGALQGEKRKVSDEESQPRKIPRYVPPKSSMPEKICPSRGNSHKVLKRIIVGNISKWIPPDWREDASSHKWTVYVRGDKDENANISTFVSKVRFFLHPSYCPNDIVEVTSYPFHLSRRGWGEFPLRVQLHFKNALNKPMDIIHHLKLDRTYTGLQTLGSETLIDVWIHMAEFHNSEQNNSINNTFIKLEANDGDSFESIREQSAKFVDTSRLITNTSEKTRVKKEASYSEVCDSSDLMLIKNSESIKIKTESNDATTQISNDKYREAICHYIDHDHNYFCKQYFNSRHYIEREGNITVEHFPENDYTTFAINSSIVENNKKKSDLAFTSNRINGDIQSSNSHQSLASSNVTINDSLVASVNATFQENNSHKNLLLSDSDDKSLQAKNSQINNNLRILGTILAKDTVTTINGFCKPTSSRETSLDCFNNLQKTASFSEICNSHLKPLQISIPPSNFTSSTSKHVLLLKDKKSVSVDLTSILPSKSNENSRKFVDGDVKVSVPRDGSIAKLNVRVPQGVSILKKPPNVINEQQEDTVNNNKKTAVLKLKGVNSLLLNVNENVPILKIADSHNPRYNYSLAEATRGVSSIGKQELVLCTRSEEKIVQRTKITLGKDKFKLQSKKDLYEAVLQSIGTANIADTEALIRFIIRRLPIVTQNVRDPDYRRLHPYACCSEKEYLAYNVGKQRAMEWYRAKIIRNFLWMKIPTDQLWSIKEIILWARLHGYTPSQSAFSIQETAGIRDTKKIPDTTTSTKVLSTCTEPIAMLKWLQTCQQEPNRQSTDNYIDDEEIDVENIKECPRRIAIDRRKNYNQNNNYSIDSTLIPIELDEDLLPFHNFVCDTARDIGIKIGPEEIVPGILYCAASRVIMRVVECFVEDLTRSSLAKAWERNGNEYPKVIILNDVRNALTNREEFDIFTNEGLGTRQELNTTEL